MNKKTKSVTGKIITGYILLFLMGVVSIVFLYSEVLKANKPKDGISIKNQQLLGLSDALSTLYQAESTGRTSDLISSSSGFSRYNQIIDSAIFRMRNIQIVESSPHKQRLDSITLLLTKKKTSVAKIQVLNNQYNDEVSFAFVKNKIEKTIDSLQNLQNINYSKSARSRAIEEIMSEYLTEEQIENTKRIPVPDSDLLVHYDKILADMFVQEDKLRSELQERGRALQDENQVLSNKIQVLVSSIEKEIRDDSIAELSQSQEDLEKTTTVLFWFGTLGILLLLLFGWIILRDLTRQQKYRDKLEELNHENSMLLRSKSMLLATVTHDLQTPLGSILGFSDLLKKTNLDDTQNQYVTNISYSSDYILNLVNDLVDFSKLENNKIKIEKVAFNPKTLIEKTFNTLKQNAVDKDIVLLYDMDNALDINVISDPYRVRQILTNLITNAIKFTQKGHVKITGKIIDGNLVFEVQDTGIGISEEGQKLIFEEFTQANPDIEQQFGGTGLGLTISVRMAELLDGKISVESESGQGSVFTFSIPLVKDENQQEDNLLTEINTDFLKGKKILIVDDDKMQLTLMEALFSAYPVELITENDATKVVALLEKSDFDLVFTDIQMPKKSGFVLIKRIRNHKASKINQLPVVALSGKRDLSLEDFTDKGFTYFIEKPMKMSNALQVIEAVFQKKEIDKSDYSKTEETSEKLYDLSSLKQFISDDKNALKNIVVIFLDSTETSIEELKTNSQDLESLSQTAHRMIPMLKQIESFEIVSLLEKLEDKKVPLKETENYIGKIIEKLNVLTNTLQTEL